jgi:hypothetical protein
MYVYGGVYLDLDVQCVRPLETLLINAEMSAVKVFKIFGVSLFELLGFGRSRKSLTFSPTGKTIPPESRTCVQRSAHLRTRPRFLAGRYR